MPLDAYAADAAVTVLEVGELRAIIDPRHGAEIAELTVSGRQVLSRTPWERQPAVPAAEESDWVAAWSGGWQILFPNAGNASVADGLWHPFHGASSQALWNLQELRPASATLHWAYDGWELERRVVLSERAIRVETEATNGTARPRQAVAVEHLTFGDDLLAAGPIRLQCGPCDLQCLDADGAPTGIPQRWPAGADNNDWSLLPTQGPVSRFGCLVDLDDTSIELSLADLQLRVRWDPTLPYLWCWLELDATSEAPWNNSTRALGLEPASYPHGLGLARACEDGSARVIGAGETWSWYVEVAAISHACPDSD
jgi:hypothetical protein